MRKGNGLRILVALALLLGIESAAHSQTLLLKSGQRVETNGIRRDGDMLMCKIEVAGRAGEVGHPIATVARIEFPEPQALKNAGELLSQGQANKALAEVAPVVAYYAAFREIPGAWWGQAAVIKVSALAALGRDREAEPLALEIQKYSTDPETARAANLRIASALLKKQELEKAAQICDAVIKDSAQPEVLADAWVMRGNIFLAQKDWDAALLAFLRVPVFYRDVKLFMPAALLGSARAYRRLEDVDRAKKTLKDLVAAFPKSAEAAIAQTEMQKL